MTDQLKPCPFCGGKASAYSECKTTYSPEYWHICCDNNGCPVESFLDNIYPTEAEAADIWNTRHIQEGSVLVNRENLKLLLGNYVRVTQVPRYKRIAESMLKAAGDQDD